MRSKCGGEAVGLEYVHLVAAVTRAVCVERPVLEGLNRALRIAVSTAVRCTSGLVLISSTGGIHLGQVQRAIFLVMGLSGNRSVGGLFKEDLHRMEV